MKRILTIITDDLDGSEDAEEVEFSVNGTIFRIDLASKNKQHSRRRLPRTHPEPKL